MGAPLGNKNAAVERRNIFKDALRRALAKDNWQRLERIAETLLAAAESGESWAIRELADRLDGKPAQSIDVTNHRDVRDYTNAELIAQLHANRVIGEAGGVGESAEIH